MTTVDFFSSLEKVTLLGVFVSNNNTIIASFGKKKIKEKYRKIF